MSRLASRKAAALNVRRDDRLAATAVGKVTKRKALALCRVAVQLAREDAGQYMTPQEIGGHAHTLIEAAHAARAALDNGKNPEQHYKAAKSVAAIFGAQLVDRGDLDGMVLGIRFSSGRYTSGAENLFYVS